jgi:hypothetical protein
MIFFRAIAVWIVLIFAEILHGITRGAFLVPHIGEFRSGQIGVFTGSLIILAIALVFVRWIGTSRSSQLLAPTTPLGSTTCLSMDWNREGVTEMAGKGRQQTARKPATKFAHLRKKMEKARIVTNISKKKK